MRTAEDIQAEMDAAEEAHEQRMTALHDELYAAQEAADPGCHQREHERRVANMAESIMRSHEVRKRMTQQDDDPSKAQPE